jgi:chromosome segregation ATPase
MTNEEKQIKKLEKRLDKVSAGIERYGNKIATLKDHYYAYTQDWIDQNKELIKLCADNYELVDKLKNENKNLNRIKKGFRNESDS